MLAVTVKIILIIVQLYGAYITAISLCFIFKRKKPVRHVPATKFAVLIPCRNEEAVIGRLVESLKAQDYPGSLYDIYAVPNNCSDNTEDEARHAGAKIISCIGKVGCKGDALKQAIKQLCAEQYDYDAFCVFDADNIADKSFLLHMNDAICSGARVAKGRLEALNPYESWVSGCYALYFEMGNLLFNRARANIGLSARLVGTGFMVTKPLIEELGGWNTVSLAEDAEFAAHLAARGEKVHWVEGAVSYDEEPNTFRDSMTQRRRWVSGLIHVSHLSVPLLLRSLKEGNRKLKLDFLAFIIGQYVQALAIIPLVYSVFTASPLSILVSLLGSYAGATAMGAFLALVSKKEKRIAKSVFTYWVFTATWLPLQVYSVFHKNTQWKEIRHTGRVALRDKAA